MILFSFLNSYPSRFFRFVSLAVFLPRSSTPHFPSFFTCGSQYFIQIISGMNCSRGLHHIHVLQTLDRSSHRWEPVCLLNIKTYWCLLTMGLKNFVSNWFVPGRLGMFCFNGSFMCLNQLPQNAHCRQNGCLSSLLRTDALKRAIPEVRICISQQSPFLLWTQVAILRLKAQLSTVVLHSSVPPWCCKFEYRWGVLSSTLHVLEQAIPELHVWLNERIPFLQTKVNALPLKAHLYHRSCFLFVGAPLILQAAINADPNGLEGGMSAEEKEAHDVRRLRWILRVSLELEKRTNKNRKSSFVHRFPVNSWLAPCNWRSARFAKCPAWEMKRTYLWWGW